MKTKTLITAVVSLILIATGCDQPNNSSNNHAAEIETNDIDFSEVIESQSISLKRIHVAKTEYYGKELEIYGYIQVDDYYNCKYRDSEKTHYSFSLRDNDRTKISVYFKKSISKDLFNELIEADKLPVKVKVIPYTYKQGRVCDIMVEGLEYEIIEN